MLMKTTTPYHTIKPQSDIQSSSVAGKYTGYRLSGLGAEAPVR